MAAHRRKMETVRQMLTEALPNSDHLWDGEIDGTLSVYTSETACWALRSGAGLTKISCPPQNTLETDTRLGRVSFYHRQMAENACKTEKDCDTLKIREM